MSKPVDVVAVLRSSLRVIPGWQRLPVTKLEADAAIDAVAELIAAVEERREMSGKCGKSTGPFAESDARIDAALAACNPAATGAEK